MHKGAELKSGLTFGGKNPDSIKAAPTVRNHHSLTDFRMATPQSTEMQVETEEVTVQEAIWEIVELEVKKDEGDPLEGLTNKEIAELYVKQEPEDRQLFRQFKRFDKTYYKVHGHDAPCHQLARGIIREMFSGLPARDAETIANTRAELLAAERLKDLCKKLGLAIPLELQSYSQLQAPEFHCHHLNYASLLTT